ncbi:MAG TPA: glucose-6-phosphate dehydrogenase assembly protein OpcA [Candidatus Angelobacter sp.]|nr:glucose-6-phosphate dehydrogenase assembly protein OpcA [Candidatus Angelobacter sp.]
MSTALPRAPLMIRGDHVSSLHAVSAELARLHQELLRSEHDEVRPVRTAVLTLVCVCLDTAAADETDEVVRQLAGNHPARVILVVADRNAKPDGIAADLALECSAIGGADQICAESVRLVVHGTPALHLTSVVGPLLLPDVPVVLWLTGAPPLDQALHGEAIEVCERIVIDSDAYADPLAALREIDNAQRMHGFIPVGDLAWARLLPWRELVAASFDGRNMAPFLHGVRHVEVESCGTRPSAEAWLLAGWLASRLAWAHDAPPRISVTTRNQPGVAAGGLLSVRMHCGLDSGTADVSVQRHGDTTVTRITTSDGLDAGGMMTTLAPALHALVGRELQEAGADVIYADAVGRATMLAGGSALR